MSETGQGYNFGDHVTQPPSLPSKRVTGSRTSETGQSFRIGNKIVRIDAASIDAPGAPWLDPATFQESTGNAAPLIDVTSSTIEMGVGYVVENDVALKQAAAEQRHTPVRPPLPTGPLKIMPAWEVDYFRWPRLARRLLKTHRSLFNQIGSQLLGDLQPTRSRIGVCSTFSREGKTTIAICLARWAASVGKRTLLIDADVERPQMTCISGMDCAFGWQATCDSDIPVSETMIRSSENGLTFMPCRTDRKPSIIEKSMDQLATLTFQMKYEFDVVIIDMGTIENICAHGTEGMDVVDAMLVTRDPSRTSVGQMMDTRRVLGNLGMNKTYVARNFARKQVA